MKVGIIGAGAYGLALAIAFKENNCDITMWTKSPEEVEELETQRTNERKLSGVIMPPSRYIFGMRILFFSSS